jgi:replicative DNA helicase
MNPPVLHPGDDQSRIRELPHDQEAEQQILGLAMMKPSLVEIVFDRLADHHFAYETHCEIWRLIMEGWNAGRPMQPPAIHARMKNDPLYLEAGGSQYLMGLCNATGITHPLIIEGYADRVIDMWLRRRAIAAMTETVDQLHLTTTGDTASQHIEALEAELAVVTGAAVSEDRTETYSAALDKAMASIEAAYKADGNLRGITTGLKDLDYKLGGLHRTDLIILAGRPSMGKSALAWNIAEAAARAGEVVAFYSLEMSTEQLAGRGIAARSGVNAHNLREGRVTAEEVQRAARASLELKELPIFIDDTSALSPSQIRTRARRVKRKQGKLGLIVIDYLQLMSPPASMNRSDGRVQEVSAITRALKSLAKELDVPVLALSQLSRACEAREDKRPQLSDLRESGSIEQDADIVMFVSRDEYYVGKAEPGRRGDESEAKFNERYANWEANIEACRNMAEVIIQKQRHGSTGTVKTFFDGNVTKFGDLETRHGD